MHVLSHSVSITISVSLTTLILVPCSLGHQYKVIVVHTNSIIQCLDVSNVEVVTLHKPDRLNYSIQVHKPHKILYARKLTCKSNGQVAILELFRQYCAIFNVYYIMTVCVVLSLMHVLSHGAASVIYISLTTLWQP